MNTFDLFTPVLDHLEHQIVEELLHARNLNRNSLVTAKICGSARTCSSLGPPLLSQNMFSDSFYTQLDITSLAYLERRERPSSLSRSSAERAKSWRVSLGRQFEHAFDLARDEDGGDEYAPTSAFHGEQPNSTRVRVDEGAMNCSRRLILIKSRNIIYDRRGQLVDAWLSDGAN